MSTKTSIVESLFAEVFQSERSAIKHPTVEAERLGPCPPADALRAVAAHASRVEPALMKLAEARGREPSKIGVAFGELFSLGRDGLADFALSAEQSYRGTLLGMRHGYDAVRLFGLGAKAEGDLELAAFSDAWLTERGPLIAAAADALSWFTANPERALANAKRGTRHA
jgi:hypothetical protein